MAIEDNEIWKKIIINNTEVNVSSYGNIKINDNEIIPKFDTEGYKRISFGCRSERIHRLVAIAFVENPFPEKYLYVDHIDGDKSNNYYKNLRWCTNKMNCQYAGKKGVFNHHDSYEILAIELKNGNVLYFDSQSQMEKILNIPNCSINKCIKGKRYTTHGYCVYPLNEIIDYRTKESKGETNG